MKRFTETGKWRDPWFFNLSMRHKMLWLWLLDNVDNLGAIEPSWPHIQMETGCELSEDDMAAMGDRVERMCDHVWRIKKFVAFQFGGVKAGTPIHRALQKLSQKYTDKINISSMSSEEL